MRDNNDNNVDDNLEHLAILGGLAHFQNQHKAQQQRAKQLEETRRLREATEQVAERAAQAAHLETLARNEERGRVKSQPQCPVCGGRLEGQFRKCKHCTSDLSWVEGHPCEPGKEAELQEMLTKKKQAKEQKREARRQGLEELQSRIKELVNGIPNPCPRCLCYRPGYDLIETAELHNLSAAAPQCAKIVSDVERWVYAMSHHGCCPNCWNTGIQIKETCRVERKETISLWIFGIIPLSLAAIGFAALIIYGLSLP